MGPENGLRQFYGRLAFFVSCCWKNTHAHKIPPFRGGVGVAWRGGGGSANFILWALGFFREKGVIIKGVFSLEDSLGPLESLSSLESLETGRILLCFPHSRGSL